MISLDYLKWLLFVGPFSHYFHGVHEQTHIFYVMAYSGCLGPFKEEPHCKIDTTETTTPKASANINQLALGYNLLFLILLWKLFE